jgi:uncharacterized membrane protein
LSSSDWTELQTLINDQNTINTLGNSVVKPITYIRKMLNNVVGQVVIFVLVLVGLLVVGIFLYVLTNFIRSAVKKQHAKDLHKAALADLEPAFETF